MNRDERGPSRWAQRKEMKRQMYLQSTEPSAAAGYGGTDPAASSKHGVGYGSSGTGSEPVCQKCLKTGHWTYQCDKAQVYLARPSRSRELRRQRESDGRRRSGGDGETMTTMPPAPVKISREAVETELERYRRELRKKIAKERRIARHARDKDKGKGKESESSDSGSESASSYSSSSSSSSSSSASSSVSSRSSISTSSSTSSSGSEKGKRETRQPKQDTPKARSKEPRSRSASPPRRRHDTPDK